MSRLADHMPSRSRGPVCGVSKVRAEHLEELAAFLADDDMATSWIGHMLRGAGYPISDTTVGRHRRGMCGCERKP